MTVSSKKICFRRKVTFCKMETLWCVSTSWPLSMLALCPSSFIQKHFYDYRVWSCGGVRIGDSKISWQKTWNTFPTWVAGNKQHAEETSLVHKHKKMGAFYKGPEPHGPAILFWKFVFLSCCATDTVSGKIWTNFYSPRIGNQGKTKVKKLLTSSLASFTGII